jgi:hypothetical protein
MFSFLRKTLSTTLAITSIFSLAAFAPAIALQQAHAEESPAASSPMASPQASNDEHSEPIHHVDENHESGIESIQLIFVGAAIVIALGLAYRAGRRRRDK